MVRAIRVRCVAVGTLHKNVNGDSVVLDKAFARAQADVNMRSRSAVNGNHLIGEISPSLRNNERHVHINNDDASGKDDDRHHTRFSLHRRGSSSRRLTANIVADPGDWGFPGFLTNEELEVYENFRAEIDKRPSEFRSTIFCFGEEEGESEALCRWLRARKFKFDDVIAMVEEATEIRREPTMDHFYPSAKDALGVEEGIFKLQYPQLFVGQAKNRCPLFISKPGVLSMDGLGCITTMKQMHKYQWHCMSITFARQLKQIKAADPKFSRYQSLCVIDLDGLSRETMNRKVMDLIQHQSHVDSLCFPETMNRLIVVNAPSFFSLSWTIIKRMLDPRTRNKIEIISSRNKWESRLMELVDADKLPKDYGGKAESMANLIARMKNENSVAGEERVDRRISHTMSVRHHASNVFEVHEHEKMEVEVFTRAENLTTFSIERADGGEGNHHSGKRVSAVTSASNIEVQFKGGEEGCLQLTLASNLIGPGKFRISAHSDRSRLSSAEYYFLVGSIVKV